jgi:hypothetical protein
MAGAAKVNDLDGAPFWISEQYVLGLEIAVDDVDVGIGHEGEGGEDLMCELPDEVEGDAMEVCVPQQVIQVVRQQLKHQAQVVPVSELLYQPHNFALVIRVAGVHVEEEANLNEGLVVEWYFVLYYLYRYIFASNTIMALDDLTKGTFTKIS